MNAAIWSNNSFLEGLELLAVTFLAIFLVWLQTNVPALAGPAQVFFALIVLFLVFYVGSRLRTLQTVGWGASPTQAVIALVTGLIVGVLFVTKFAIFNAVEGATLAGVSSVILFTAIIAPLTEETFFRAALQPTLAEQFGNLRFVPKQLVLHLAVFLQAAIFGVFHYAVSGGQIGYMVSAFVFGLIAGYGNIYSQSTLFGYSLHLVNNAKAVGVF